MTKKEKTKLIVWSCVGAALVTAILLFFLLPRRGDKLLRLPDAESVYGLYMVDSTVTPYDVNHFFDIDSTTKNAGLIQAYYDLLTRTKLYFVNTTGGIKYYADEPGTGELISVYVWCNDVLKPVTFRPDGIVYYGSCSYRIRDEALLSEYLALFERIKEASADEGISHGNASQEQFDTYQKLFDAPSWYAQAVAAPFSDGSVNLNSMFYDGLSYGENSDPVYGGFVTAEDGDEWAWVQENVPGATETDVSRLPREGMYQVLRSTIYGKAPIPEDLAPEGWTYWDETDCWYHAHGDTGINSVTLTYARLDGGGSGFFQFENAFGQICTIDFVLGQTEQDAGHVYLRGCDAQ